MPILADQAVLPSPPAGAPPPPKNAVVETLKRGLSWLAERLLGGLAETTTELSRLRDDMYNVAMLNNPATFAARQSRTGRVTLTTATPILVYENVENETVLVYVRAANAGEDIYAMSFSVESAEAAQLEATAESPNEGRIGQAILRPAEKLYVTVKATTSPDPATPIYLMFTVLYFRGRANVFGG